jgi:2-polyprenyl-6-methoxyphenol hydroxylase-like FAD-dependent oxidoreductase
MEAIQVRCCIAGGGPAGMMLGYLLARAGVEVMVLEKHADFLRDFRGDTIHPSTLEVMRELGALEELLRRPHQKVRQWRAQMGNTEVVLADFSKLPVRCRFVAMMPQWDFLDFLAGQACRYPTFHLRMEAEVTAIIEETAGVAGVRARTPGGALEIRADLVVGADGRSSIVRDCSGLAVQNVGAPMDVLWMRLSKHSCDPTLTLRFDRGRIMATLDRGDYWQCAFVIPKGDWDEIQRKGIEDFRSGIVEIAPFLRDRVSELRDWSGIKLLTVKVDRLRQWYRPGLLCIGDAAHAMSPVGGVGINLAIQDAVAAANILTEPLRRGTAGVEYLAKIQRRRALPTRLTQGFQVMVQKQLIAPVLGSSSRATLTWRQRLVHHVKFLLRIRGRIVGMGFRPEHVRTPDVSR